MGRSISRQQQHNQKTVRQPGNEPRSIAWKATMLTFTPQTTLLICNCNDKKVVPCNGRYNDVSKSIHTLTITYIYATFSNSADIAHSGND